jgi:hypothetical protein
MGMGMDIDRCLCELGSAFAAKRTTIWLEHMMQEIWQAPAPTEDGAVPLTLTSQALLGLLPCVDTSSLQLQMMSAVEIHRLLFSHRMCCALLAMLLNPWIVDDPALFGWCMDEEVSSKWQITHKNSVMGANIRIRSEIVMDSLPARSQGQLSMLLPAIFLVELLQEKNKNLSQPPLSLADISKWWSSESLILIACTAMVILPNTVTASLSRVFGMLEQLIVTSSIYSPEALTSIVGKNLSLQVRALSPKL